MPAYNQLLNDVCVDYLAITSTKSDAIDMLGFRSVAILAKFSDTSGTVTFKLQESATTTDGDFTDLTAAYYDDGTVTLVTPGSSVLTVTGTATASAKFLALQFNRPGKESSVPAVTAALSSKRYLRIVATSGTCSYAVALKYNADFTPVTQLDILGNQMSGTN